MLLTLALTVWMAFMVTAARAALTPSEDPFYRYEGSEPLAGQAGEGKIPLTQPMLFTAIETAEIGTTVLPNTSPKDTEFTGQIKWVELSTGEDDHSDMIDPDDMIHSGGGRATNNVGDSGPSLSR